MRFLKCITIILLIIGLNANANNLYKSLDEKVSTETPWLHNYLDASAAIEKSNYLEAIELLEEELQNTALIQKDFSRVFVRYLEVVNKTLHYERAYTFFERLESNFGYSWVTGGRVYFEFLKSKKEIYSEFFAAFDEAKNLDETIVGAFKLLSFGLYDSTVKLQIINDISRSSHQEKLFFAIANLRYEEVVLGESLDSNDRVIEYLYEYLNMDLKGKLSSIEKSDSNSKLYVLLNSIYRLEQLNETATLSIKSELEKEETLFNTIILSFLSLEKTKSGYQDAIDTFDSYIESNDISFIQQLVVNHHKDMLVNNKNDSLIVPKAFSDTKFSLIDWKIATSPEYVEAQVAPLVAAVAAYCGFQARKVVFKGLAKNLLLRSMTPNKIRKAFRNTDFTLSEHALEKLKDPRLEGMGVKTLADVAQIMNRGTMFDAGTRNGARAIGYRFKGVEVIFNPVTRNIITVRPRR